MEAFLYYFLQQRYIQVYPLFNLININKLIRHMGSCTVSGAKLQRRHGNKRLIAHCW